MWINPKNIDERITALICPFFVSPHAEIIATSARARTMSIIQKILWCKIISFYRYESHQSGVRFVSCSRNN